jgi:hypothetical protein
MPFPYKNPLNAQLLSAPYSVPRNSVQGTDYSVLGIGGWMEVANLSDLSLTFSGFGLQTLSANTVPINIYIGNGTPFNPSYVNLNSDNFSSGRRRVGMIVYVNETGFAYQYEIDNYESLWNAATGATGTVTTNLYDTQVRNNSAAGQNFINAWTGSTIEGVSGTTREEARWRIFHGTDTFITGGTYFSGSSTIQLYVNDGTTIPISGITTSGGSSSGGFTGGTVSGATNFTGGLTANTISATTYLNLPPFTGDYLPLSGGTVSGATNFTNGLTIYGNQLIESQSGSSISTTGVTITSIPKLTGSSAHFEYVIINGSGYMRAGTVMTVWDSSSATFNDTSTPDLNGSTLGFVFDVIISGSNLLLRANVTSGTWSVKVGTRIIF